MGEASITVPAVGSLYAAADALERTIDLQLAWNRDQRNEGEWRYADLAKALDLWERNGFWRARGFSSMNEWMERKAFDMQVSRGTLYSAKWVGSKLGQWLTGEQMRTIGKSRLTLLARVTLEGQAPPQAYLDMALAGVKVEDFEASVRARRPLLTGEDPASLDLVKVQPFFISRADYRMAAEAFKLVRQMEGIDSRDKVFVVMVELANAHYSQEKARMMEEAGVPQQPAVE